MPGTRTFEIRDRDPWTHQPSVARGHWLNTQCFLHGYLPEISALCDTHSDLVTIFAFRCGVLLHFRTVSALLPQWFLTLLPQWWFLTTSAVVLLCFRSGSSLLLKWFFTTFALLPQCCSFRRQPPLIWTRGLVVTAGNCLSPQRGARCDTTPQWCHMVTGLVTRTCDRSMTSPHPLVVVQRTASG